MPKPLTAWITMNYGKFLMELRMELRMELVEYQTTWPASWEICMQVRKQELELDMEQHWFQIRKGIHQGCILSPCLFNLYAEYIMRHAGLDEAEAGIKIARRNINNLRYADDTTFMAESKEELKSLLKKMKEKSKKVGLNFNIHKMRVWDLVTSLHSK